MFQPVAVVESSEEAPKMLKVQIPMNMTTGDSFCVTTECGKILSVTVPEGSVGGSFLEVIIPQEGDNVESANGENKPFVKLSRATIGAAVVGVIVGSIVFGPPGGIILGGVFAYATTREHGKIGEFSRKYGNKVFNGMEKVGRFVARKGLKFIASRNASEPVSAVEMKAVEVSVPSAHTENA